MNSKIQNKIIRNSLRKALLLFCMIILSVSSVNAQYYKNYSQEQKKKLAEAYYLVGKQYQSLGKAHYETYFKIAYMIYPELDPNAIKDEPETLDVTVPARKKNKETQDITQLINYRFKIMSTYFLSRDVSNMLNFFDSTVYIGDTDSFVTKNDITASLQNFYSSFNISGLTIDKLFDLNSIKISVSEKSGTDNVFYILTVKTQSQALEEYLPFWHEEQSYYWYDDPSGNWVILAIGKLPENRDFLAERETTGIKNQITANFKTCLTYFIDEDLEGVSQYLADNIELIPLNTTVSRDEIEYTFAGYFEESERLEISSIDDLVSNITVNYNKEYSDKYQNEVYLLEITVNAEYTPQISFWAAYKKYYFIKTDSDWKIRAIG